MEEGERLNQITERVIGARLTQMAQMPLKHQGWYVMSYLFLGAISDAISSALSGKRSLEESARQWRDNPMGAIYGAWAKSGLSSWLARPVAIADALGIPFSPGNLFGGGALSKSARGGPAEAVVRTIGPLAGDLKGLFDVSGDVLSGRANEFTAYNAGKLLPFQNLAWLRLLWKTTGLPVVPEALLPKAAP